MKEYQKKKNNSYKYNYHKKPHKEVKVVYVVLVPDFEERYLFDLDY